MWRSLRKAVAVVLLPLVILAIYVGLATDWQTATFGTAALAQDQGQVPGNALGNNSDSDFWRAIRQGEQGTVSIQDKKAGLLVQSEGENWRALRNGPLSMIGAWFIFGMVALLALFFALRGRIKIEAGPSGKTIERFNVFERFAHWLTAGSFIVLALTGLNLMYGRYFLKDILGDEVFATLTLAGKYAHNYVAFAFMAGLVLVFVLWAKDNLPSRVDLKWLAQGGGMFAKGQHPPAKKFNAGQKVVFWLTILGGISISVSGIALLFPFQFEFFAATFKVLNAFGFDLPTDLTVLQEMQYSQLLHAFVGLGLIALIIAHIYIATIGMQGAFQAMGSGMVDENWAKEHHSLWAKSVEDAGTTKES